MADKEIRAVVEAACAQALGPDYVKKIILSILRAGPMPKKTLLRAVDCAIVELGFVTLMQAAILDEKLSLKYERGRFAVGKAL